MPARYTFSSARYMLSGKLAEKLAQFFGSLQRHQMCGVVDQPDLRSGKQP